MGFFSYNCRGCGHSLLSSYSADKGINEWMTEAIALFPNGDRVSGEYDGYGRLGFADGLDGAACWHRACWEQAGKPDFDEASRSAADQGYFFDDGDHDVLEPGVDHPEGALEMAVAERAARRLDHDQRRAFKRAFEDASWALYEIEDKERREEKKARLDALKEDFRAFTEQQPCPYPVMDAHFGEERNRAYDPIDPEVAAFGQLFDALKAHVQYEWLAERNFEVKHYVPFKTEASYGY